MVQTNLSTKKRMRNILFIIFIIEFLNTKIKTPQDIEKELGLPLLGVIPEEL